MTCNAYSKRTRDASAIMYVQTYVPTLSIYFDIIPLGIIRVSITFLNPIFFFLLEIAGVINIFPLKPHDSKTRMCLLSSHPCITIRVGIVRKIALNHLYTYTAMAVIKL